MAYRGNPFRTDVVPESKREGPAESSKPGLLRLRASAFYAGVAAAGSINVEGSISFRERSGPTVAIPPGLTTWAYGSLQWLSPNSLGRCSDPSQGAWCRT